MKYLLNIIFHLVMQLLCPTSAFLSQSTYTAHAGFRMVLAQNIETNSTVEDFLYEEQTGDLSLRDTLSNNYKSRTFRRGWEGNYQSDEFNYADVEENKQELPEIDVSGDWSGFFEVMIVVAKILGFAILGFLVYLIVRALLTGSGFSITRSDRPKSSFNIEQIQTDLLDGDWIALMNKAVEQSEYKLAVRYYFLAYLKALHLQKRIELHPDKVNRDYRNELSDYAVKSEFEVLSRLYDYCWFGDFEIDKEQFERVRMLFDEALKK